MPTRRYEVARYADIPPADCPCGQSRRAFLEAGSPASMHVVEIKRDSRTHWHKRLTEYYYVLAGRGTLEADGDRVALAPGMAVRIEPGCRHRAVPDPGADPGQTLKVLIVAIPPFDPADEFEDA